MRKSKILVVEDQRITAEDIKETLEGFHYVATSVSTGEAAVRTAKEDPPDLVLMDIVLKGKMDGIEAAQHIMAQGIPVIYLTSHTDKRTLERAGWTEPSGYLAKPYSEKDLYSTIAITLQKTQKARVSGTLDDMTSREPEPEPTTRGLAVQIREIGLLPPGKEKNRMLLAINDIEMRLDRLLYIQAKGRSCRLILDTLREPAHDLTVSFQQLEPYCTGISFFKVHRSYIVMADRVLYINKKNARDYELWLKVYSRQPIAIPVGRSNLSELRLHRPEWFRT